MTPPQDMSLIEGTRTAIIGVSSERNKTATEHPTAITRELAERLLQRAQEYEYPVILPNYDSLFLSITILSERKYGIRLTSHYLRKRFETICARYSPILRWKASPEHFEIRLQYNPPAHLRTTNDGIRPRNLNH